MLTIGMWYLTRDGRYVKIEMFDEVIGKFVGEIDAQNMCFDADGKAHHITGSGIYEAPGSFGIENLEPVPAPIKKEYSFEINIEAKVKMRGISYQEAIRLLPDLIDLEALSEDVRIGRFSIKVEGGHLLSR